MQSRKYAEYVGGLCVWLDSSIFLITLKVSQGSLAVIRKRLFRLVGSEAPLRKELHMASMPTQRRGNLYRQVHDVKVEFIQELPETFGELYREATEYAQTHHSACCPPRFSGVCAHVRHAYTNYDDLLYRRWHCRVRYGSETIFEGWRGAYGVLRTRLDNQIKEALMKRYGAEIEAVLLDAGVR